MGPYRTTCRALKKLAAFVHGLVLGQVYYYYLLQQIFPGCFGYISSIVISVILGLGNTFSVQLRCISVLIFPMYCGKPGRGVLKAVILTYIVTGPITNMGLNAKEVVRVFACSTQLAHNLSMEKYDLMVEPVRKAALGVRKEVDDVKYAFRSMKGIIQPLQQEIEDPNETDTIRFENDLIDDLFHYGHRSEELEMTFATPGNVNSSYSKSRYVKKLRYRCENHLSRAAAVCIQEFTKAYNVCCELMPNYAETLLCTPMINRDICDLFADLRQYLANSEKFCEPPYEFYLGQTFLTLKNIKTEFVDNTCSVHLQYRIAYEKELIDIQDAKETAERVQHAFEEKIIVMHHILTVMNICVALLFFRIYNAALSYHDIYLTNIDYDNVYITEYFRELDARRAMSRRYSLLPLKKMERNRYIDVYSLSYKESQRSNLIMQILKLLLEVVTATTFVMLDRLFFEALEVVRQHAEMKVDQKGTRDLDMKVEGIGILATMLRTFLNDLNKSKSEHQISNSACLPHPRQMPYVYFLKIYGGYTWIVVLLFASPYTLRLKRKAVQAVRAHYLSGDILSLLSARMRFPQLLGWLRVLPAARMSCLICGETQPRSQTQSSPRCSWFSCIAAKCPFVYCAECWREAGARCLACEPSLADLSDIDSLTDDEPFKY